MLTGKLRRGATASERTLGARWTSSAVSALLAAGVLAAGCLAAPPAEAATDHLSYFGGPVMHSEQVVIVDWGSLVDSTFTDPTNGDPGLVNYLASQDGKTTDIGGLLAQYADNLGPGGALENSANAVSYGGEYQIVPSVGNGSASATVDDSAIQSQLQSSIAGGALPAPLANGLGTVYLVLFPQKDAVTLQGSTSGVQFCAYHNTGGTAANPLLYAVIPDNGSGTNSLFANGQGCGSETSTLANETSTVSHEFAETVNDPEVGLTPNISAPLAWYEKANGEIADICDLTATSQDTTYAGTWTVQDLWSNVDNVCEATEPAYAAPTAGTISPPATVVAGQAASFSTTGTTDPSANTANLNAAGLGPGIAAYSWNWGDGSAPSSGAAPQHTYAQGGQYTVTVTVTDDLGFTATTSTPVTVYSGVPAVTTATPATSIADTTATLPGTINPNGAQTTYQFTYGLSSSALNQSTTVTDAGSGLTVEDVSAILPNLTPGTTYYYELVGTANGTKYDGGIESFTTTGTPPPPPAPVVSTGAASHLTGTAATLTGTVNPDGLVVTHQFAWGTGPNSLTHLTPSVSGPSGMSALPIQASLSGLTPGKTYYFEAQAAQRGNTVTGQVKSFRTFPTPSVTIAAATKVTAKSATLNGTVNPHRAAAHYSFQYGITTAYGHSTPSASAGSGASTKAVSAALTGLRPGTKYHYRLLATGPGGTVHTADRTLTTTGAAGSAPRLTFALRGRPSSLRGIRITFHCDHACSAGFSVMADLTGPGGVTLDPIALAEGTSRLGHAGNATLTLRPTAAGAAIGRRAQRLELALTGAAWTQPGLTRRPVVRVLTLR